VAQSIEAFGKYLLLERLAVGGMAEVYLAKSFGAGGIGKFVAVKRILPQFSDNQEFIDMFKEEAKIVMNLNHSNIVSIYDFGVEKGQFFLVMEFVEGQNLRQTLNFMKKQGKYFSIDQIVYVAKEVAAGLDHAHRCIDAGTGRVLNITHRDMSPQNVMVSFEGEVKVVDFGIAKAETQLEHTRSGTIKGKFGYMSPEQAEGQLVDARTDIFSLGIVLWELLAQDRLFSAQSEAATLKKIKDCQVPPIRKLNPAVHLDLERIVSKCLVRDRAHRYQSAEALAKDLSRFLNTHFPEFSKQEFSKFLKSLYQEMFIENRKKLAEYAKIDHEPASEPKTSVTRTMTSTGVVPTVAVPQGLKSDRNDAPKLQGLKDDSVKIDLDKLKVKSAETDSKGGQVLRKTNSNFSIRNTGRSSLRSGSIHGTSAGTSARYVVRPTPSAPKAGASVGPIFMAVAVLIGGIYFWQSRHGTVDKATTLPPTPPPLADERPTVPDFNASKNLVNVTIDSRPQGAKVTLNGQFLGLTPMVTHLPAGNSFRIKLVKEGYENYESVNESVPPQGYQNTFSLKAEPPAGKISIQAYNAGPQPQVYVDGILVAQALPTEVKIKAGSQVQVKIVNPVTKTMGIENVVVGQGQTKPVYVILNKEATVQ
jgi:serine/threonine-protein kinase